MKSLIVDEDLGLNSSIEVRNVMYPRCGDFGGANGGVFYASVEPGYHSTHNAGWL